MKRASQVQLIVMRLNKVLLCDLVAQERPVLIKTIHIDTPAAAAAFANLRQRQIVFALIEKERSLSELAKVTAMPLNLLHHHIRKLMTLKLVGITGQRTRPGAPIKLYRAAARTFFVPAALTSVDPNAALTAQMRSALERSLVGAYKGVLYSHDGVSAHVRLVRDPKFPASTVQLWCELRLSNTDAAALAEELKMLMKRYESRQRKGRHRYIVHAAVAGC